jgi:hypothetical protein
MPDSPCEACEPYVEPSMQVVPADIRMKWTGDLAVHAAFLHAEVARLKEREAALTKALDELRATFGSLMDEADWHVESCDCAGCQWFAEARRVLKP